MPDTEQGKEQCCGDCRFYKRIPTNLGRGICRWGPPSVTSIPGSGGKIMHITGRATIDARDEGCFQFKKRPIIETAGEENED